MIIPRLITKDIERYFHDIPVTAIVGARQVGKSTLAKELLKNKKDVIYLDLEKQSDRQMLSDPEAFFNMNSSKIICIDEIQLFPGLFTDMRSFIDSHPETKFVILGSSSPDLFRQSSETLAGRIFYYELSPFLYPEIETKTNMQSYRLRGGLPLSLLAREDKLAFVWLNNYITTFLERDLRMFGYNIAPEAIRRFWAMAAHVNGQVLNYSLFANSLGISQPTVKHYVDILRHTFMLRILQPYYVNIKKRLVKSPKLYFRDTGVLNALLNITDFGQLFSHPVYGSSWEITVIENIINVFPEWQFYYYRTAKGVEIDLVLTKGNRVAAIEIKSSSTPVVTKGFWTALEETGSTEAYIIAPVKMPYPLKKNVMVYSLEEFLKLRVLD